MKIGILALQGDYQAHSECISAYRETVTLLRTAEDFDEIQALILPGGESTTQLRLMSSELHDKIYNAVNRGLPILATCAGTILISKSVTHPRQDSLGLLDIDVTRNAYGRQIDSFIEDSLHWTPEGRLTLEQFDFPTGNSDQFQGVFIRAPQITRVGTGVEVLAVRNNEPVLVRKDKILAATFHPELSIEAPKSLIHELLLSLAGKE